MLQTICPYVTKATSITNNKQSAAIEKDRETLGNHAASFLLHMQYFIADRALSDQTARYRLIRAALVMLYPTNDRQAPECFMLHANDLEVTCGRA